MSFIKDDMIFEPYVFGGFQCKIKIKIGIISVRFGSYGLFTSPKFPYEVWYPDHDSPDGDQTAEDIWNYIKVNS